MNNLVYYILLLQFVITNALYLCLKYGCIHIFGITNTDKVLDIPSRDVKIIYKSVMWEPKILQVGVTILR